MRTRIDLVPLLPAVLTLIGMAQTVGAAPPRPQGPCDIYGAAGTPCVAAHSTTRALYASYNGPLYQVKRPSDGKTLDIGVIPPSPMRRIRRRGRAGRVLRQHALRHQPHLRSVR